MPILYHDGSFDHVTLHQHHASSGAYMCHPRGRRAHHRKGKTDDRTLCERLDAYQRIPPSHGSENNSFNFASTVKAATWLRNSMCGDLGERIEVVKDFRYLGAHLTSGNTTRISTPSKRWENAIQQLRKLKHTPATIEAKAKPIVAKTFVVDVYGIEAAEAAIAKIIQLAAAVIDAPETIRTMWTCYSLPSSKIKDLDMHTQIFTRRAMQIRSTICNKTDAEDRVLRVHQPYVKHSTQQPPPSYQDSQRWEHTHYVPHTATRQRDYQHHYRLRSWPRSKRTDLPATFLHSVVRPEDRQRPQILAKTKRNVSTSPKRRTSPSSLNSHKRLQEPAPKRNEFTNTKKPPEASGALTKKPPTSIPK